MAHRRNLLTDLHQLARHVDDDLGELAEHLADVTDTLDHRVSGSAGLQLTVIRLGLPITLDATATKPGDHAVTSLRLPLPLLSPKFEPGGRAVLYSTAPGTLVNLAADLTCGLIHSGSRNAVPELDVDLPLVPGGPLLTGFDDLSTLNRALGVLIDQGQLPDAAYQTLSSQAAAAHLTVLALAHQVLGRR